MGIRLFNHPVLCNYYLTYRCNARCGFCDIWERPSPYADRVSFEANLRDLKRLKVKVLDLTGGEPLLHREIDWFLRRAKELGFITTVTTNCLLYPKWAERLAGLVDMLHFSVDAATAETHNASRGVACFEFVLESIARALQLGERPDILLTVTADTLPEIEPVYEQLAKPNGLILILNPIFGYNNVGTELLDIQALQKLRDWGKKPGVYLNDGFIKLRKQGGNQIDKPVCVAGSSTVVISPENNLVLPCYHLGLTTLPIENNLYDLYRSAAVQEAIALEGRHPKCQGCTINCYMQPSFAYQVNEYFFSALPSTLKYAFDKWVYA
jgi:MoaA/NifB/PqqE/SkfB family radical SAM enzyme